MRLACTLALGALTGCALIEIPIRLIALVVTGVFRLGTAIVTTGGRLLGNLGRAVGPYLLFWTAADPASGPGPSDVEVAVVRAAREDLAVRPGFAEAARLAPAGTEAALLVTLPVALAPDAAERIARVLRGRRLLGVAFAAGPGEGPAKTGLVLIAPASVAAELDRLGFGVEIVPDF